tara:strand:+ start:1669 stop:2931 length:1263 start_codon:yes stop_codon:yes gene_type:complete
MKKLFKASSALFPYFALALCFGSGSFTFGLAPSMRVPLLFTGFLMLSLFWLSKLGSFNSRNAGIAVCGIGYGLIFVLYGYIREQNTIGINNIVFTLIASGFFVNGVLWGGSKVSKFKISNFLVICAMPIAILILSKSTTAYTQYLNYAINLLAGGRELSLDTGNPVGVAYANSLLCITLLFLSISVRHIIVKVCLLLGALLSVYIVISTASRGAILYIFITSILFIIAYFFTTKKKISLLGNIKKWALNSIAILVFSVPAFLLFKEKVFVLLDRVAVLFERFYEAIGFLQGVSNLDQSTSGRFAVYEYHLVNWLDWIVFGEYNYAPYPHNLILEVIMRIGLMGFPLCIIILYILLKNLYNLFNNSFYKNADWYFFYFLYCFSFMQSMTSLSLEINRGVWLSLGFLIVYSPIRAYKHSLDI